jgi:hypothetical protein
MKATAQHSSTLGEVSSVLYRGYPGHYAKLIMPPKMGQKDPVAPAPVQRSAR